LITAVRGKLELIGLDSVIVEVGGVSLRVFVPVSLLSGMGEIGQEVKLYTHFYIREDQMALYGFKSSDQLELFELLLGVSGVGPKAALTLVGASDVQTVHLAISQNNVDYLKKIPGIGPKTAGRIILELKGKLVDTSPTSKVIAAAGATGTIQTNQTALQRTQVIEALTGLGYSLGEVQRALSSLPADKALSIEEQVFEALRYLGQG
jgi:Holliday junction DNA helicase RuvA